MVPGASLVTWTLRGMERLNSSPTESRSLQSGLYPQRQSLCWERNSMKLVQRKMEEQIMQTSLDECNCVLLSSNRARIITLQETQFK